MKSNPCFIVDDQCQILFQEVQQKNLPVTIQFRKWRLAKTFTSYLLQVQDDFLVLSIPNEEPLLLKTRLRHVTDLPKQGLGLLGFQFIVPDGTKGSDSAYHRLHQAIDLFRALE